MPADDTPAGRDREQQRGDRHEDRALACGTELARDGDRNEQ